MASAMSSNMIAACCGKPEAASKDRAGQPRSRTSAFKAVFGVRVARIGCSPLFVVLAMFDILAVLVAFTLARPRPADAGASPIPLQRKPATAC